MFLKINYLKVITPIQKKKSKMTPLIFHGLYKNN